MDNEYELLALAQEEYEDAVEIIYQRYKPIIKAKSHKALLYLKNQGVELLDIMQEGYIGLDYAIKHYSQISEATFATFANLCIEGRINNYLRSQIRFKYNILNNACGIDELIENTIKDKVDVEDVVLNERNSDSFIYNVRMTLSGLERDVFDLKLYGYKLNDLARILKIDNKAIYNALQRIKNKINYYKEIDDFK